jgi:hypothetical protein
MMDAPLKALPRKQRVLKLHEQMKTKRTGFDTDWRDCADHLSPRRARFTVTERDKGGRATRKIIDSTGTFAVRTLSAGMMSGVSSPARPWFKLITTAPHLREVASVTTYLADVTEVLLTVLARSNVYNTLGMVYTDLGVFGTSAMALVRDNERIVRAIHFPVGSYCLATNHKGEVRTFAREFEMTVEEIVQQFGVTPDGTRIDWSRISRATREAYESGNRLSGRTVVHVVTENPQYDPAKLESYRKRYYQCYAEAAGEEDVLLEESGFDEFPILAPRWDVIGGDAYACEWPGSIALGDIQQLQFGEKELAKAVQKMVNPPLVGPTALKNRRVSLMPGDVTHLDETTGATLRPIHEVNLKVGELKELQQIKRYLIERAFFADLFLMLQNLDATRGSQPITATEIKERHEEKLLALGPVLERLNADLFDQLITLLYVYCLEAGLLPEPPEELEGEELPAEYTSIMAQAQKMVALATIDHVITRLMNLAALNPNDLAFLDKIDLDQVVDEIAKMTGLPPRIVRSDDVVAEIRQRVAAQQQAAQEAEVMAQQAAAARDLSAADTGGQNALTDLLTMTAGPLAGGVVP